MLDAVLILAGVAFFAAAHFAIGIAWYRRPLLVYFSQAAGAASVVSLLVSSRLARERPELLAVAATYDLGDLAAALDHVARRGKGGTVLLASPLPE